MDARRKQVYTGIYRFTDHRLETVEEQMAVPVEEMIKKVECIWTTCDLSGRWSTGIL